MKLLALIGAAALIFSTVAVAQETGGNNGPVGGGSGVTGTSTAEAGKSPNSFNGGKNSAGNTMAPPATNNAPTAAPGEFHPPLTSPTHR